MDFTIPREYLDLKEAVFRFSKEKIAPHAQEMDLSADFSWNNWKNMASMGLQGLPFPEKYGGGEASPLATCIAMEAMGAAGVDAGTPLAWAAHRILFSCRRKTDWVGAGCRRKILSYGCGEVYGGI